MRFAELLIGLLALVAAIISVSRRLIVPYPVLLVVGGLALSLIPGVPQVRIRPDIVFLLFLPPLLYWESVLIPLRELQNNVQPIAALAIGLVLASACAVAWVAHALIPGMSLATAFVLGSILAPTDEVAVGEVASRLSIPRRTLYVIEGESLVNDGISLVIYKLALAAVVTGSFSLGGGVLQFFEVSVGGVAVGLTLGWLMIFLRRFVRDDPPVEITLSLITPFAVYVAADRLGLSSVLAVVAAGLYVGRLTPRVVQAATRLQSTAMWEMISFLLNGVLFILTGMEIQYIRSTSAGLRLPTVMLYAAVVVCVLMGVRILWVLAIGYLPGMIAHRRNPSRPKPTWKQLAIVSWAGIRGAISLAAALAVPLVVTGGGPFPDRHLLVAVSFYVILITLVVQGVSLPFLIRGLDIPRTDGFREEEARARVAASRAALARLDSLMSAASAPEAAATDKDRPPQLSREVWEELRHQYETRVRHFSAHVSGEPSGARHDLARVRRDVQLELLKAERDALLQMRDEDAISAETLRRLQHEIDLEFAQLQARH